MVRSHAQHLEALLAEQRLIAAQKPNLQLCWKFLEDEIARVKAAEKAQPTRSTPVKTPSGRAKHTPTPTKKATPERHGTKTTPEHAATKKPAPAKATELPEAKTAPVKAPSMLQRVKRAVGAESKVQPVSQKEDALSPVEKAETPSKRRWSLTSPLKQKNTQDQPEVLSPASRLRRRAAASRRRT